MPADIKPKMAPKKRNTILLEIPGASGRGVTGVFAVKATTRVGERAGEQALKRGVNITLAIVLFARCKDQLNETVAGVVRFMPSRSNEEPSALRRARLSRNWTLEEVVEEIDLRTPGGHSGVTPSMLSGWELGRHTTSIGHRKTLCEIYGEPPDALFASQDAGLRAAASSPRLLASFGDLRAAMLDTVTGARDCLVVTGSRSRDAGYLAAIESALAHRPGLVHYRVLFGPPHHRVLRDHLLRLLELRDPEDRSLGVKTLHLGIVEDTVTVPERFFCASEQMATVPIPSLTSAEAFDSGMALGALAARRLLDHGRQAYAASRRLESADLVAELDVVRDRTTGR